MEKIESFEMIKSKLKHILDSVDEYLTKSKSKSESSKFITCVKSEIKYLEGLESFQPSCGSNFYFLQSVFLMLKSYGEGQVLKVFKYDGKETVRVDLVVNNGTRWICIKARKSYRNDVPFEDQLSSSDDEEECDETLKNQLKLAVPDHKLVRQAKTLQIAATRSPIHYKSPQVVFQFVRLEESGLPVDVLNQLLEIGIKVEFGLTVSKDEHTELISPIINLDIPTLVAMVSCITFDFNRICPEAFDSIPLQNQHRLETEDCILPILLKTFKNKKLICVRDAFDKFSEIVSTIGGYREKQRAYHLFNHSDEQSQFHFDIILNLNHLKKLGEESFHYEYEPSWKVFVIPNNPSKRIKDLSINMSHHNMNVFGTGERLSLTTVTANAKFIRSIDKATGFKQSAIIHQPRGLIEQKWVKYSFHQKCLKCFVSQQMQR